MIHPLFVVALALVCALLTVRAEARYPYQSCFEIAADLHDVPLDVLLAVAAAESAWNPDARSAADAHGIMQIQWPGTARHLGVTRLAELYNPCLNIDLGARYLKELLARNDGDLTRALASYNYGPTRIDAVADLPTGALGYVAAVTRQRDRIQSSVGDVAGRSASASDAVVRFDHGTRARHFAETLNQRIASARFRCLEDDQGFVVSMQLTGDALSFADVTLLEILGWPGIGRAP